MRKGLSLTTLAVFFIALLYSSVGHAGASGYIAIMSLFSLTPEFIKPAALTLNILVASIGTWHFWRAGHFSWGLFWPLALLAIPCAFLGGYINLPVTIFKIIVGMVLLFSAVRFLMPSSGESAVSPPPKWLAVFTGAGLGFLAGLTGTGGGIFLSPVLMLMHWANTKTTAATSVFFILVNSIAGLLGHISSTKSVPLFILPLAVAVIAGGALGSYWGSHRLPQSTIKRLLAIVLTIAGIKLILD